MKSGIIYVGSLGFPLGSPPVNRRIQIIGILQKSNFNGVVILRYSVHNKDVVRDHDIKVFGNFRNIRYFHGSLIAYRPKLFLIRNLHKLLGVLNEFFLLVILRIQGYKHLISDTLDLRSLKYYSCLSKLLKMTLTYDYVEYVDSLKYREAKNIQTIPSKFDNYFIKYVDQIIVISKFLQSKVIEQNKNISTFYLPPTLEITEITTKPITHLPNRYIAYCGSAAYMGAIQFLIESFSKSEYKTSGIKLLLIINGNKDELRLLAEEINGKGLKEDILLKSKIKYNELISYYKNSLALLLPLSNSVQDKARFPFKLCEYTFAGKPIITNNVGVVNDIFTHNIDAIISPVEDLDKYTYYLNFIYTHREEAEIIGRNGYKIYEQYFSSSNYRLDHLFSKI